MYFEDKRTGVKTPSPNCIPTTTFKSTCAWAKEALQDNNRRMCAATKS